MSYRIEDTKEGFLQFTITRTDKRNAVNYDVMEGLREAVSIVRSSEHLGLVLTGEGDYAFCSGGDLSVFHKLKTEEEAYGMLSKMADILFDLFMLPKPTIALMNGAAVGGGCEIAIACDFRFAHKKVKAGFVQGTLAITTGWGGGTMLLEKMTYGQGLAMLLKAKIYDADYLKSIGFIDYVYEGSHADGLASGLETIPLIEGNVLQAYKQLVLNKRDEKKLKQLVLEEVRQCSVLWEKDVHHSKVNQFFNK